MLKRLFYQDWKGKFGFLKCDDIPGKIFLHSKDIQVEIKVDDIVAVMTDLGEE